MNTTRITIRTKSEEFINALKNEKLLIREMDGDYITVFPVRLELHAYVLIAKYAISTKASVVAFFHYQDGSGLDERDYTIAFENGEEVEYCERYGIVCPYPLTGNPPLPQCVSEGECPLEDFPDEMEAVYREEANSYVEDLKSTMDACWHRYDEAMRNGEDVELDDSYFEADMALKDIGIAYSPK